MIDSGRCGSSHSAQMVMRRRSYQARSANFAISFSRLKNLRSSSLVSSKKPSKSPKRSKIRPAILPVKAMRRSSCSCFSGEGCLRRSSPVGDGRICPGSRDQEKPGATPPSLRNSPASLDTNAIASSATPRSKHGSSLAVKDGHRGRSTASVVSSPCVCSRLG